jgi:hypothetical protein
MDDERIIKFAAKGFILLVVAPIAIGATEQFIGLVGTGIYNGIEKVKFNKKIKKGLKDGSIVKIDGNYYEVLPAEEA